MFVLPKIIRKVIASLLVFVFLFLSASSTTHAQTTTNWYNPSYQEFVQKVSTGNQKDIFGERYTYAQVYWIIYSLTAFIQNSVSGPDIGECLNKKDFGAAKECLNLKFPASALENIHIGKTQTLTGELAASIAAPGLVSTASYITDLGKNLKLVPEANAQTTGFGFNALNPVLEFWKGSRNISYGFFVIAIIVMSFMIMFRVKISPQVVITVQSAIPKIVIALILVTFSYAIAGLLIDLMYVVIAAVGLMGSQFLGGVNPALLFNFLTKGFPFPCTAIVIPGLTGACTAGSTGIVSFAGANIVGTTYIGVIGTFFVYLVGFLISLVLNVFLLLGVVGSVGAVAGIGALIGGSAGIAGIIGILLVILLVIIIIVMIFKILWMLLKAYANIILLTIFAPFQILAGTVLPGAGFGNWLKSFISNLATFVVTGGLFLLSFVFLIQSLLMAFSDLNLLQILSTLLFGKVITAAATIDPAWPPLLGGGNSMLSMLMLGTSFVLFTLIPKTAQLVEALIKGQQFAYGSALSEAVSGPAGFIAATTRYAGPLIGFGQEAKNILAGKSLKAALSKAGGTPSPASGAGSPAPTRGTTQREA